MTKLTLFREPYGDTHTRPRSLSHNDWTTPHIICSFLKEYIEPAALIADFLSVSDRLVFLHTHKYVPNI